MAARILMLVLAAAVSVACAQGGGSSAEPVPKTSYTNAPEGSKLAKVGAGMNDAQVRKVMGDPDNNNAYMTGKAWIPFYYGPDTHRTDWMYEGQGRVVFSRNRYSGALKVIRVHYDPMELK